MGAPLDLDALRARLLAASGAGLAPDVRALLDAYAELRDAAAAVVAALPTCDVCGAPAMRSHARGLSRFCDDHGAWPGVPAVPPYPRAAPLRRLLALLGETRHG
jgi:hypothetical protein